METLQQYDLQLFYFINHDLANRLLDFVCPVIRDKRFLIVCYTVFSFAVSRLYPKQFWNIAVAGALTFLLTDQISSHLIKPVFHRLRPCNDSYITARLIIEHCGSGFSFVSSHATNSFGMAAFLSVVLKNRSAILILIVWASLVSFSQVYVGIHYPADVIAGGVLGIAIGAATGIILKTKFDLYSS